MVSKLVLKVKSVEDIKRFRTKLQGIKIQFPGFQAFTVRKLGNEMVLDQIHKKMRQNNFSEKIIDGTTIGDIEIFRKKVKMHFKSEYFSDAGFDVALAREKGTKDHSIDAPEPTPERPNPHLAFEINGKKIYAKHVDVKGLPSLLIIRSTIKQVQSDFIDKYNSEFAKWYSANMGGFVSVAS